ncbi:V-type ATPase, D subunit [Dactylosporangium vinaceum]|uniref:V-type ATP synthase subunit D n=1 Tax=Dactylosporangium vinaceum TaxID=53362 RepID=A0ABV5MAH6_9ACTN|nr:V-type ATP synthase subunit D [Dactylosporangium vinaceum]UAB92981.1 V-type ATPase, D subunit [Dactylosporangium vinaceum]
MTGIRGAPPGRAGVLWLRRRLALARRGSDVLCRKVAMLAAERERLRQRARVTGRDLAEADAAARTWLRRAAVLDGADAFAAAAADATPLVVHPRWTVLLGVRCAAPPDQPEPGEVGCPPPAGGAALHGAAAAYRSAAAAAVRHAAAVHALTSVEAALTVTRQRVRALDRRWIPRLEAALGATDAQLAELESADAVRRRRAARP